MDRVVLSRGKMRERIASMVEKYNHGVNIPLLEFIYKIQDQEKASLAFFDEKIQKWVHEDPPLDCDKVKSFVSEDDNGEGIIFEFILSFKKPGEVERRMGFLIGERSYWWAVSKDYADSSSGDINVEADLNDEHFLEVVYNIFLSF